MPRYSFMRTSLAVAMLVALPVGTAAQDAATRPEGSEWHLVSYDAEGEPMTVPWMLDATLVLEDGAVSGYNGCNTFTGSYTLDGTSLTFDEPFAVTRMACDGDPATVEQGYMSGLPSTTS